jgi:tRNA pseudouridine38-40 synthase
MTTYKVVLAYDGTQFVGWQRQADGTSIQGLLEDALRELDRRDVAVIGAGRTDAGVHALGQVAGFSLERAIAPDALIRAINARLPDAVRVLSAVKVSPAFHARFGARSKTYRYRIWNGDVMSPFQRAYTWHVSGPLAVEPMIAAARVLEGTHDFASFQATGGERLTTDRVVFSSRVIAGLKSCLTAQEGAPPDRPGAGLRAGDGRLIVYEIAGNGFLRHMVRIIVGTLVEIGRGRRPVEWVDEVLASRDRARAGPTAPAEGLVLACVEYEADVLAAEGVRAAE